MSSDYMAIVFAVNITQLNLVMAVIIFNRYLFFYDFSMQKQFLYFYSYWLEFSWFLSDIEVISFGICSFIDLHTSNVYFIIYSVGVEGEPKCPVESMTWLGLAQLINGN